MSQIDFTKSPADIFKDAARVHAGASAKHQEALASIEPLRIAVENAKSNLDWVAAHPGLAGADLGAIYAEAAATVETEPLPEAEERPAEEPAKPKRTRRTKAQIEADKAAAEAEAAAKAQAPIETTGPGAPAEETFTPTPEGDTAIPEPEDDTFSEAAPAENVVAFQPPAAPPAAQGFLNPFAQG